MAFFSEDNVKNIFVIGGAQIYRYFIYESDELHITFVDATTVGIDTYFPISMAKIKSMCYISFYTKEVFKRLFNIDNIV